MTHTRRSLLAALGVGTAALAGCTSSGPASGSGGDGGDGDGGGDSGSGSGSGSTGDDTDTTTTAVDEGARAVPVRETALATQQPLDRLQEKTLSGGPPKDGIPSIDDPAFESADAAAGRLSDGDIVFGVARNGIVKAYPQSILVWHEICNDVHGDQPVSVTYCPLTGTVQGFLRGETTFGVSGRLVNSNLVMYDRATDSRWPQLIATAKQGWYRGQSLQEFELTWTTWGQWTAAHPDTQVLTEDTGYARNYGGDPYGAYNPKGGYYLEDRLLFPALDRDDRFDPKEVVIGTRDAGVHAFHKATLREQKLLTGDGVLAVYDPTLDTAHVYRADTPDAYTWADGQVEGPEGTHAPAALPLERAVSFDAMWFAWYGFYPETEVHA